MTAADWGNWADVYDYTQRPNGAFVSTNITPVAMKQLQVNALLICDLHGNLVLSAAQDYASGKSIELDLANRKALPDDFPWRRNLTDGRSAKGLIGTNHGVMMIAAAPVLNGSGSGKPMGMVILGRLLTAARGQHARRAGPGGPVDGREWRFRLRRRRSSKPGM